MLRATNDLELFSSFLFISELFIIDYVLLSESEKKQKPRHTHMATRPSPKPPVEARTNTLLDDGGPVAAIHHEGEHLPSSAHGPRVTGRRDHGGSGKPLGPAPLYWCWLDARGEGHLWR